VDLVRFLVLKEEILRKIVSKLSSEDLKRSKKDYHAKRAPRPCGLTIHTGTGCSYCCVYCYIYDMGFNTKVSPYPLRGIELVAALLSNPYFIPTLNGTLLAFGSITEPFLPEIYERTLEYLQATYNYLQNPIQISTKASLTDEQIIRVSKVSPRISVLVTLITLKRFRELEPLAPHPLMRLKMASKMFKLGFHVSLFIRPLIPSVTDHEIQSIFETALSYGVKKAVLGSLRVTNRILRNLKSLGIDLSSRLSIRPEGKKQVPIRSSDIKSMIRKIANKLNIEIYPSACAANISAHRLGCAMCKLGPCGDINKLPHIDEFSIRELLRFMNIEFEQILLFDNKIRIKTKRRIRRDSLYYILSTLTKRAVYIY